MKKTIKINLKNTFRKTIGEHHAEDFEWKAGYVK